MRRTDAEPVLCQKRPAASAIRPIALALEQSILDLFYLAVFIHRSFDHAGIFTPKFIVNNPQHFFPIFLVIELLSQLHQLKLGNGLNFHVDKELPKFFVDVVNDQNDVAIFQTLPVEIGLKFRGNGIAGLLVDDAQFLDLIKPPSDSLE
ncbi:MAG TPA: hypothetical protein VMV89_10875 [Candidatus Paceibacterota bacterium]|nr:hypothetical protein [Candidatus Paceibacterota bacterium]